MKLDGHIIKLVGETAQNVIVIADSEIDVNTSSVKASDIAVTDFARFGSIKDISQRQAKITPLPEQKNLAKGVHIEILESLSEPLHVVFEESANHGGYVFLSIADHVQATIIEHHTYCDCGCFPTKDTIPIIVEGLFGAGSHVDYNAFDMSGMSLSIERHFEVKRDTNVFYAAGMFGENCQSRTYFDITETGANVESKTMMFVKDGNAQKHLIQVNHYAGHTKSFMRNHGVVAGKGRGEFENIGFIERDASLADAQQESRIMTLDEDSKGYVHPILLIDEYDVVAGHAGSVGRASEEALYYLQSRGLKKQVAQLLITEGFLRPVVEDIADAFTKERIETVISEKVGLSASEQR